MSFIDMYANDVWSESDITHRTEALLHGQVSKEQELILSRKMIGFSLGLVIPTAEEQIELTAYQVAAEAAQQAGIEARADMALLQAVLDYEAGGETDSEMVRSLSLLRQPITNVIEIV